MRTRRSWTNCTPRRTRWRRRLRRSRARGDTKGFSRARRASGRKSGPRHPPGRAPQDRRPLQARRRVRGSRALGAHRGHRDASLFGRGRLERAGLERAGLESSRLGAGSHSARAVDQVNTKAPFSEGSGFAWHQDASFLKPLARDALDRNGGVNVVVAMDASDAGNGGFEVLGGTRTSAARAPCSSRRVRRTRRNPVAALAVFDEPFRRCRACDRGTRPVFPPHARARRAGANVSARRRRIAAAWSTPRRHLLRGEDSSGFRARRRARSRVESTTVFRRRAFSFSSQRRAGYRRAVRRAVLARLLQYALTLFSDQTRRAAQNRSSPRTDARTRHKKTLSLSRAHAEMPSPALAQPLNPPSTTNTRPNPCVPSAFATLGPSPRPLASSTNTLVDFFTPFSEGRSSWR